jgi:hypothetical protein
LWLISGTATAPRDILADEIAERVIGRPLTTAGGKGGAELTTWAALESARRQ